MDIEFEVESGWRIAAASLVLAVLASLAALGRATSPLDGGILTPSEWQLLKARRAYSAEAAELRAGATLLIELLNRTPDPVAAGLAMDRIRQRLQRGEPGLALQREVLLAAAEAVRLWAMGGDSRASAVAAMEEAVRLLEAGR